MTARQTIVSLACLSSRLCLAADSPQEAARQAMEASIARQRQAVATMQVAIEKQRAALAGTRAHAGSSGVAPVAAAPFFTLSWPTPGGECDPLPEIELHPLIQQAAQQEGVDPTLLRAVARQESGLRSCAVSSRGAMGLMQLMPATAEELGLHDPFDPAQNLLSGARLLKQLLDRFGGNTALALGAYNAGASRVEQVGGVPQIPETIRYVQQILGRLGIP